MTQELTLEQKAYLRDVMRKMKEFENAYNSLSSLFDEDYRHDLDINDFITGYYPFDSSFNELAVWSWSDETAQRIKRAIGIR